jgi:hypothetical protein
VLAELRIRTRISAGELEAKQGRNLAPGDWNILLTGPAYVFRPDGRPLCVYLPGVLSEFTQDDVVYAVLDELGRSGGTDNRGLASGTVRLDKGTQKRSRTVPVRSVIAGAIDPGGVYRVCRTTVWTGANLPKWQALFPLFNEIDGYLREYVPRRHAAQLAAANETKPEWVVPGTPFSTITVNDTYPTGVHTDKGDLETGFSTLLCARRGDYTGGQLVFPEYRVAVDMHDGDLLLMDAHEWHGNAAISCRCGNTLRRPCPACGTRRLSLVTYFRTKLTSCGTAEEELGKARRRRELKV